MMEAMPRCNDPQPSNVVKMNNLCLGSEEVDMKQRLPMMAIALIAPSLLCACATGLAASPASSPASLAAPTRTGLTTAMASVQGFYRKYVAARNRGRSAAGALLRTHVAGWYLPILDAPNSAGTDRVDCGLRGAVTEWSFKQVGVLAGQAVIVIGSRPGGAPQEL